MSVAFLPRFFPPFLPFLFPAFPPPPSRAAVLFVTYQRRGVKPSHIIIIVIVKPGDGEAG